MMDNPYPKPRRLYNLYQAARSFLNLIPHDSFNNEDEPGQIYQCLECGYIRPWSRGASDEMPDVCDYCWERHRQQGEIVNTELTL